jgi:RecB family exonuclease
VTAELPNFSASRFHLYRTCPRLYRYQYIDGLPGNTHVYTVMGSALHAAIEQHYKHEKNPAGVFSTRFNEGINEAMDRSALVGVGLVSKAAALGQGIIAGIQWWTLKPSMIEVGFSFPFPTHNPMVQMRGFIDMITEEEYIIDHKSGSKKPTALELAHNPQLLIYCWAYRLTTGRLPKKVFWHHLRTHELVEAKVLDGFEDKLAKLEADLTQILSDREYAKIERGYFCDNLCAHKELCWPDTYGNSTYGAGDITRLW